MVASNVWRTPHHKVMLAWDPDAMPPGWGAGRDTYFTITWNQLVVTWSAFALFIADLVAL